ncbi:MAG: DNA primase [Verrucomicrobiota bacterium]
MAIPPETIEQVRRAVDIVDVIDAVVPLKRAGANYKALSPFNKEKTPSFMVSRERQSFKCYSSGHGGDVFKFVMLYENVDFPTAIRRLAQQAGIEIVEEGRAPDRGKAQKRDQLLALHAAVARYWRNLLLEAPEGEPGRRYLQERQIPMDWATQYDLGYAPEKWDDVLRWGEAQGYSRELMEEAGLLTSNDRGRIYDRFRGRLIFSIHDEMGQVIAFSARLLDSEAKAAKYVNSPETPLFTKSKVLFGYHRAKRAILDHDQVLVCEGQIDVLRCHSVGIEHVVAPLGTSFTEEHARLIHRNTKNVVLCLDADKAGQRAATRAADLLIGESGQLDAMIQSELGIFVVPLPEGQDPDSLIVDQGPDAFKEMISKPSEYIDFLLQFLAKQTAGGLSEKRRMIEEVAHFLNQIPNRAYQEQMTMKAARNLEISADALAEEMTKLRRRPSRRDREEQGNSPALAQLEIDPDLDALIQILVSKPEVISDLQKSLNQAWVEALRGVGFLQKLIELYNDDLWAGVHELMGHLSDAEQAYIAGLNLSVFTSTELEDYRTQIVRKCDDLKLRWVRSELARISTLLNDPSISVEEKMSLLKKQSDLKRL